MDVKIPRIVIAGLSGDNGKTIVSLSLLAGLRRKGLIVSAFKKGPDYIDPAWLSQSAGSTCRNLDTFMVDPSDVYETFVTHAEESDIAVIEGNRGLFDGQDVDGTHSTAQLARLCKAPVILVVNVTKTTRTVAAVVKGCQVLDPEVNIAGVVLNRVGGQRHRRIVTEAVEKYCDLPVVGAIPRLGKDADLIPGRHLGLVPPTEHTLRNESEDLLVKIAREYLDLDRMIEIAGAAEALAKPETASEGAARGQVRIGYFQGSAFTFYYPENLEALQSAGADLVPVNPLENKRLPEIDGLYIGGGFPETHAEKLVENRAMMDAVKTASDSGMPVYAECGGLIYLSRSFEWNDKKYPMAGVFDLDLTMSDRPVGHGYSRLTVSRPNPFFELGETVKGHEFHYSGPVEGSSDLECCMKVNKGTGVADGQDGLLRGSTVACYTHLHARGVANWAPRFVSSALGYRTERRTAGSDDSSGDKPDEVDKQNLRVA